jgi:Tfp pilus assembly protein FimT
MSRIKRAVPKAAHALTSCASAGFGIVEILIALSVLAIGTLWAVPAVERIVTQARFDANVHEWTRMLERARDEVLRTGLPVSLCPVGPIAMRIVPRRDTCVAEGAVRPCLGEVRPIAQSTSKSDEHWDCARMLSMTPGRPTTSLVNSARLDRSPVVAADPIPLTFMPPLGRIAGRPRHVELRPRTADRRLSDRSASWVVGGERARCVLIAASGRVRVREGLCDAG